MAVAALIDGVLVCILPARASKCAENTQYKLSIISIRVMMDMEQENTNSLKICHDHF